MRKIKATIVLSGLIAFVAYADDYSVQIGTYRSPDRGLIEDQVQDIGEINSATTATGLIEYSVGSFTTHGEARDALERLQAAGFDDAFVRRSGSRQRRDAETHRQPLLQAEDGDLLSSLSEEERRSVVYLDGRLHKKIGDQFIPLDSALDEDGAR